MSNWKLAWLSRFNEKYALLARQRRADIYNSGKSVRFSTDCAAANVGTYLGSVEGPACDRDRAASRKRCSQRSSSGTVADR